MKKLLIVIPTILLISSFFIPGIVDAKSETLVDVNKTITDGSYFVSRFSKTDDKRMKLHIDIEVTPSESVDILIMDESNFNDYKNNESYNVIWSQSLINIETTAVIHEKKDYRIVVDNSRKGNYYAGTDVVADLKITAEDMDTAVDLDGNFFLTGLCFIGLLGLVIMIFINIVLYFLFIKEDKSEKSKRSYMQQKPAPPPGRRKQVMNKKIESKQKAARSTDGTKLCKHCGTEIDADSKFCKKCGKRL